MHDQETIRDCVLRMKLDQEDGLRTLFENYFEPLVLYCTSMIGDMDASKDIVQDIFVSVWERRRAMRHETFEAYLYRSASNRSMTYLKKHARHCSIDDLDRFVADQLERPGESDAMRLGDLKRAINNLPEKCRVIFTKAKLEGYSYAETARILELSIKTVENQMGIALRKVRKELLRSTDGPL